MADNNRNIPLPTNKRKSSRSPRVNLVPDNKKCKRTFRKKNAQNELVFKEGTHVVEKILEKRYFHGRAQFLLKWRDYPEDQSTWEPIENLSEGCMGMIGDFEAEWYAQQTKNKNKPEKAESLQQKQKSLQAQPKHKGELKKLKQQQEQDSKKLQVSLELNLSESSDSDTERGNENVDPKNHNLKRKQGYQFCSSLELSSESDSDDEEVDVTSIPGQPLANTKTATETLKEEARKWKNNEMTGKMGSRAPTAVAANSPIQLDGASEPKKPKKSKSKETNRSQVSTELPVASNRMAGNQPRFSSVNPTARTGEVGRSQVSAELPVASNGMAGNQPRFAIVNPTARSRVEKLRFESVNPRVPPVSPLTNEILNRAKCYSTSNAISPIADNPPTAPPSADKNAAANSPSSSSSCTSGSSGSRRSSSGSSSSASVSSISSNNDGDDGDDSDGSDGSDMGCWDDGLDEPHPIVGLERGLMVEKILKTFKIVDTTFLVVKWKGYDIPEPVLLSSMSDLYPSLIIEYFESLQMRPPTEW